MADEKETALSPKCLSIVALGSSDGEEPPDHIIRKTGCTNNGKTSISVTACGG